MRVAVAGTPNSAVSAIAAIKHTGRTSVTMTRKLIGLKAARRPLATGVSSVSAFIDPSDKSPVSGRVLSPSRLRAFTRIKRHYCPGWHANLDTTN